MKKTFPKVYDHQINKMSMELRYSIIDSTGDAMILEYAKNGLKLYKNSVGVITNSPPHEMHLANLNHFSFLSRLIRPSLNASFTPMVIPGDYTSTSRFIRTAAILHSKGVLHTADEGVNYIFHVMNAVDMPKGKYPKVKFLWKVKK